MTTTDDIIADLVAQPQSDAAECLEYVAESTRSDYEALVSSLAIRFGNSPQLFRIRLRHVRLDHHDLQVLAGYMEVCRERHLQL